MLGLMKKDLFVMRGNWKHLLLFLAIILLIAMDGNEIFYFVPVFISVMVFMTTFSYDDYNKWNAYAITLVKDRTTIVRAKYIGSILLTIGAILITYLFAFVVSWLGNKIVWTQMNEMMLGCSFAMILLQSFMFPLIFKYGTEKGRLVLFFGFFFISAVLGFLVKSVDWSQFTGMVSFLNSYGLWLIIVGGIILFSISYIISKHIYQKKEF